MKLNYSIDENDIESQRALQQAEADAPKANVVAAMQSTLARVLQSQTPPQQDPAAAGQTAAGATASWGKAQ
jgi:hypothetical protein